MSDSVSEQIKRDECRKSDIKGIYSQGCDSAELEEYSLQDEADQYSWKS